MNSRAVVSRTSRGLVWLLLLALVALLAVTVAVPRLAGATPYTVLTGSMQPSLPPGTFVAVRPVDTDEIGIGSVITYQLKSGEPEVATHRVVGMSFDRDGEPMFRTKGEANSAPDQGWVRPVQVRGEVWYAVPELGRVTLLLNGPWRDWLVKGLAAGLLVYAAVMVASDLRPRRRLSTGTHTARLRHG